MQKLFQSQEDFASGINQWESWLSLFKIYGEQNKQWEFFCSPEVRANSGRLILLNIEQYLINMLPR
jgi:hypothetical protein